MPTINKEQSKPWRAPKPKTRATSDQQFYNSQRWRKVSKIYRRNNPLCEVSKALGRTVAADVVDHLIRIVDENGARYDENNFMSMCHYWHNVKSGKESHGSLNLPYELNILERKIPKNKMDIIKILVPDYKKEENHIREGGLNLK